MSQRVINLVSYGNQVYERRKNVFKQQADNFGVFQKILIYGPNDLDSEFSNKFKNILNMRKGGGYWIWKPYIINKVFKEMNKGEYLVYLDTGCNINKNGLERFNEYLDMLDASDKGCISMELGGPEKTGLKRRFLTILI